MKRSDEVLALGQVHTGLAADTRVDHGQYRGRNLNESNTA